MTTSKLDLSRITLTEVVFLDCTIEQHSAKFIHIKQAAKINLNIGIEFAFDRDSHFLSSRLDMRIQPVDAEEQALPFNGRFNIHFGFVVENLEELLEENKHEGITIPNIDLTLTLLSIAYSTSRGMIFGKVAGTPLEGYSLPITDSRELLNRSVNDMRNQEGVVKTQPRIENKAKPKTTRKKLNK